MRSMSLSKSMRDKKSIFGQFFRTSPKQNQQLYVSLKTVADNFMKIHWRDRQKYVPTYTKADKQNKQRKNNPQKWKPNPAAGIQEHTRRQSNPYPMDLISDCTEYAIKRRKYRQRSSYSPITLWNVFSVQRTWWTVLYDMLVHATIHVVSNSMYIWWGEWPDMSNFALGNEGLMYWQLIKYGCYMGNKTVAAFRDFKCHGQWLTIVNTSTICQYFSHF